MAVEVKDKEYELFSKLSDEYYKKFKDSFPTFKYANRVDACIEAMQKCLKEGKPEEVDPDLVY